MDFLYRTKPPAYRSTGPAQRQTCTTTRPGFLEGIWCAFFGGLLKRVSPSYRTVPPSPEPAPGEEQMGEDGSCEPNVEPRGEIHIYPGG